MDFLAEGCFPSGDQVERDRRRKIKLKNGLVDVKLSAADEIWSGVKLSYRLKTAGKPAPSARRGRM